MRCGKCASAGCEKKMEREVTGRNPLRWASRVALLAVCMTSAEAFIVHDRSASAGMYAFAPIAGALRAAPLAPSAMHKHRGISNGHVSLLSHNGPQVRRRTSLVAGFLALKAQRQGSTRSVEMANEAKQRLQSTVFKVLGGTAVSLSAAYCFYTGQNPIEVVQSIANSDPQQVLTDSVEYIESLGPWGYVYFSAIYIIAEMVAIPAVPLTASAGYLFGVIPGTCVVLFSATIAAGGAFIIGRVFLRDYIESIISKSRKFLAIDEAISRRGFQLVVLLRLSPLLPFALSNYLYGMTKVSFLEYLAGTAIGFAPGSLGFVMTGQVGRDLMAEDAATASGLPWYAYAGGITAVVVIGKVVAQVASNAIAEVEAEFDAKEAAALAAGTSDQDTDRLIDEESVNRR
mmetsp:Transcript_85620/g.138832  ORF Transcript_85620/g.138832 Transcript_85620/m.138832 type:complete len:401 (+) Transcript_85620:3-1205(+)